MVSFHQPAPTSPVRIFLSIKGLQADHEHGFHVHEMGDLTDGCKSAGTHFNPHKHTHGSPSDFLRHAGDLGNILADEEGIAELEMTDSAITLYGEHSIIGRAVIVHAKRDDEGKGGDEESLKTGNAGGRIACGIVGVAGEFREISVKDK